MQKRDPVESAKGLVKRFHKSLDRPMRTREQVLVEIAELEAMLAEIPDWGEAVSAINERLSGRRAELARIKKEESEG